MPEAQLGTSASALLLAAAVGSAAVGGVFLAFSSFVLRALGRLPAAQGIRAMQSINTTAVGPVFMTALFGTALLCVAVVVTVVVGGGGRRPALLLAGAGLYLLGVVVVTVAANVPMNDGLAALDPDSASAAAQWTTYLQGWTGWNHVRTVTGLVAAALLALGLRS